VDATWKVGKLLKRSRKPSVTAASSRERGVGALLERWGELFQFAIH
jgi:hypothetical protein